MPPSVHQMPPDAQSSIQILLVSNSIGKASAAWVSLFLAFVLFLGLLAVGPTSS